MKRSTAILLAVAVAGGLGTVIMALFLPAGSALLPAFGFTLLAAAAVSCTATGIQSGDAVRLAVWGLGVCGIALLGIALAWARPSEWSASAAAGGLAAALALTTLATLILTVRSMAPAILRLGTYTRRQWSFWLIGAGCAVIVGAMGATPHGAATSRFGSFSGRNDVVVAVGAVMLAVLPVIWARPAGLALRSRIVVAGTVAVTLLVGASYLGSRPELVLATAFVCGTIVLYAAIAWSGTRLPPDDSPATDFRGAVPLMIAHTLWVTGVGLAIVADWIIRRPA